MGKLFKIAGIATVVALIGAAVLGISVYAQETTPTTPFNWMSDYVEQVRDLIASKLGVDQAALDAAETEAHQEMIDQFLEDGTITQNQADRILSRLEQDGFGMGKMGRFGDRGGVRRGGGAANSLSQWQSLAEQLGMTTDELAAELEAGKTIAELAEEKGVDLQAAQLEAMKEQIQQAVEDGKLTQEQADWMLQGLEQGFMPGGRGFGFGGRGGCFGGHGGRRGFWGQSNQSDQIDQTNL